MKKQYLFTLIAFVFMLKISTAQIILPMFPKGENFDELKSSKLIVGLMDTTDKKDYFSRMYNSNIMYAIKTYWNFCSYEFGNISDYIDMKKAKDDVYLLVPIEIETMNFTANPFMNDSYYSSISYIQIGKAKDLKIKKKLVGKNYALLFNKYTIQAVGSSYEFITVCTSMREMQAKIERAYATKEERKALDGDLRVASKLKDKTLLVDKRFVSKKVTEADIKAAYGYDLKIVSADEIVVAIKNKDASKAFFQTEPLSLEKDTDYLYIKTCDDLKYVYATSNKRGFTLNEGDFKSVNKSIEKK